MERQRHPIRTLVIIFVLVFGAMATIFIYNSIRYSKMGQLTLSIAPSPATFKLGGKHVKGGRMSYITPGTYDWELSFPHFETKTGKLTIKKGEKKQLDLYLQSADEQGDAWLKVHPEESYAIEGAVGRRFDELSEEALKDTPLIGELPFIAPGEEFKIDYGSGTVDGKPKTTIYIQVVNEAAKTAALDWIRSVGTDPNTLTIEYTVVPPVNNTASGQWDQ